MNWQASRRNCILTIGLVFLTGAVCGAFFMDLGAHRWVRRSAPFWTEAGKAISLEKWKRDLDLTPEQTRQIESILDDFGMYYRNVMSDGKSRILKILNEEQRKKFDRLLGEAQKPYQ